MPIVEFENLKDAVKYAKENTSNGDVVAMSPASASFDLYDNFMIRGDYFKKLVNEIKSVNSEIEELEEEQKQIEAELAKIEICPLSINSLSSSTL